jgi:hypothetical protein
VRWRGSYTPLLPHASEGHPDNARFRAPVPGTKGPPSTHNWDALPRAGRPCLARVRCRTALVGCLGTDNDAKAHVISIGHNALSPLKASRRSVLWQPMHSNFRCSYPAAFMVASCSIRAIRIEAPHEIHNIANRPRLDE